MKIIKNYSMEEKVNDELIIMDVEENNIITLNSTATVIWNLLNDFDDFDILCLEMQKLYGDVDSEEIMSDLDEIISSLVNAGIVLVDG